MNFSLIIVAALLVGAGLGLSAAGLGRLVANVFLLGMMAYAGVGFLACFEPGQASIPWLVVYVLSGLMSAASLFHLNVRFDRFET